jgi:hypothetical protein
MIVSLQESNMGRKTALLPALLLLLYGGFLLAGDDKKPGLPQGENQGSEPTVLFNGKSYLKINTAELFYLLRKGTSGELSQAFVVRGIVKKSPELERAGRFALLRVNMVCCIADAMAMGVMVNSPDADHLSDGEWVRVFGRIEPLPSDRKLKEPPTLDKIPYTMIFEKAVLLAEAVEKVPQPEAPYMFELPGDTEYHY